MKPWLFSVFALVGLVAVVAILPASRWLVLSQFDVLEGRWRVDAVPSGITPTVKSISPIERGPIAGDSNASPTAQFLSACTALEKVLDDTTASNLFNVCREINDARHWATFVRLDAMSARIPPKRDAAEPRSEKQLSMLDMACRLGDKLDSENAFFPLILSSTLSREGKEAKARSTLIDAAKLPKFEDYSMFETDVRFRYAVDTYGYRGDQTRALMLAAANMPQFGVIWSVGRHFADAKDPEACYAIARLGGLLIRQSRTIGGVWIGTQIASAALSPGLDLYQFKKLSESEVERLAMQLQERSHGSVDLEPIARSVVHYHANLNRIDTLDERSESVLSLNPAYSAAALLSLLLLPFALGAMWLKTRSLRFAQAAPYLTWLAAFSIDQSFFPHGGYVIDGSMFGAGALLFIPALFERCRRITDVIGVTLALGGFVLGFGCFPLILVSAVFLAGLSFERRLELPPALLTAGFVILGGTLASAFWIGSATQLDMSDGIVFGALAAIGMFSAIPVRSTIKWQPVVGMCCAFGAIWFGLTAYRDIAFNKAMIAVSDDLENSGDWARSMLQIENPKH